MDFAVPVDYRVKLKECEKRDEYLDLARDLKKTIEHERDDNTNCYWRSWYSHQRIGTRTEGRGKTHKEKNNNNKIPISLIFTLLHIYIFINIERVS